ncbi:ATP-binding protein [Vibrio mediterranei]|jgi:anti-sigma regulatory factor (Ser/Thr protein kinase)|uniref:ATP-binding protein n=1 Tax=Vibrio mediterranei TaxID=689 RepID=A0ABX5D7V7_9VIBR|nr:ATP-binding protein [Vibrio mediterranei]MCG9659559.1 ATP-binding protein [Vibrio mediterranei]MCG9664831.1 ATP-binding protein [Vibrio mediterranei]PCD89688.1 ATP-binding protein [Vibrio mediterranei]PRQ65093.1 ATP-binding protein [Vibrio mediterranei]PTC04596.1 ATP-binding protein [Vibrio mediterranei]
MSKKCYHQQFESSIDSAREIADALHLFWTQIDLRAPLMTDLELCVVEVANNIYEHAYRFQDGQMIEVACSHICGKIVIELSNVGLGLCQEELEVMLKTPLQRIDLEDPETWTTSGRGFYILNTLLDEVTIMQRGNKHTFCLVKHY